MKTAIHSYLLPAAAFLLLAFCIPGASAHEDAIKGKISNLVSEDLRIASDTPGIELFLRNKHPKDRTASTGRVLLYVHGATYPSETAFDLRLDGLSWMDYIAAHGWDVWLVDLRGYGRSTRPPEMEKAAKDNVPLVTTDVAVRDVGAAVDYIMKQRGISKLSLLGRSVHRVDSLESAQSALDQASLWSRPFVFVRHLDSSIAQATWSVFKPAVPTTVEGLIYASIGMLVLMAIYHLGVKYPIVRARERRTQPAWARP